jgi:outer membrane cobalamin receptor
MRYSYFLVILLCLTTAIQAQTADTLAGTADEIVVTATRTERKLSNVAVPVSIISVIVSLE